jgi:hypothetical protein
MAAATRLVFAGVGTVIRAQGLGPLFQLVGTGIGA